MICETRPFRERVVKASARTLRRQHGGRADRRHGPDAEGVRKEPARRYASALELAEDRAPPRRHARAGARDTRTSRVAKFVGGTARRGGRAPGGRPTGWDCHHAAGRTRSGTCPRGPALREVGAGPRVTRRVTERRHRPERRPAGAHSGEGDFTYMDRLAADAEGDSSLPQLAMLQPHRRHPGQSRSAHLGDPRARGTTASRHDRERGVDREPPTAAR